MRSIFKMSQGDYICKHTVNYKIVLFVFEKLGHRMMSTSCALLKENRDLSREGSNYRFRKSLR